MSDTPPICLLMSFQSRNRETYDSNYIFTYQTTTSCQCFNLVIEKLMIPTANGINIYINRCLFQSRNRETYDSNPPVRAPTLTFYLFQSRNRETYDSNPIVVPARDPSVANSFNLVIEKLMIPTVIEKVVEPEDIQVSIS